LPAAVATNDCAVAPPIGELLRFHWYDAAEEEVSVTLPPAQKEVGPEAVMVGDGGGSTVTVVVADVPLQPVPAVTLTL